MLSSVAYSRVPFRRTRTDYVPQARKSPHRMLGIIVVPRHAVVIEECEQFVPVLFNSLLKRQSGLRCAFHGDDVLDETYGRFLVLAQMSCLQAMRVYGLNDLAKQRAKSPGDLLQVVIKGFLCKSSLISRIRWIRHFC